MPASSLPTMPRLVPVHAARPAGGARRMLALALFAGLSVVPLGLASPAQAQEQPGLIADMQVRLTQLEQLVRELTGELEQSRFRNRELTRRLDLLEREIDMGLSGGAAAGSSASGAMAQAPRSPATGSPSASANAPRSLSPGAGPQPRPLAPDTGVLGYLGNNTSPGSQGGGGSVGSSPGVQNAALPPGPPESQYQHAFSLLRQGNFQSAEGAFSAFIATHPGHTLAGNAQYWLGETHYARGNYEAAARAFAKGYKDYPSGSKTPDNLFKLGLSMSALGKKREACAAFQKLRADYPGVAGTLSRQVADQMARNGC